MAACDVPTNPLRRRASPRSTFLFLQENERVSDQGAQGKKKRVVELDIAGWTMSSKNNIVILGHLGKIIERVLIDHF